MVFSHFIWKGNMGPTSRFEAGKMFGLIKEEKVNSCVLNYPAETETAQYMIAHLLDAQSLCKRGRFAITSCTPLQGGVTKEDGGIYPNGGVDLGQLDPFFEQIVKTALRLF